MALAKGLFFFIWVVRWRVIRFVCFILGVRWLVRNDCVLYYGSQGPEGCSEAIYIIL